MPVFGKTAQEMRAKTLNQLPPPMPHRQVPLAFPQHGSLSTISMTMPPSLQLSAPPVQRTLRWSPGANTCANTGQAHVCQPSNSDQACAASSRRRPPQLSATPGLATGTSMEALPAAGGPSATSASMEALPAAGGPSANPAMRESVAMLRPGARSCV